MPHISTQALALVNHWQQELMIERQLQGLGASGARG
jgi:hypothetical protein